MKCFPFVGILLLFLSCRLWCQDPHFSQFFANRVYLNPAYAGFDPGTTISLNYRDQWFGLPDGSGAPLSGGFRTINATINQQVPCLFQLEEVNMGMALSAFHDGAGTGPLVTNGFSYALSFERQLGPFLPWLKRFDIRAGMQLSMMQKQVNDDYLIYSYQLDPIGGLISDPSMRTFGSNLYFNSNVGLLFRAATGRKKNTENLFSLGITVANFNTPNISLVNGGEDVQLPVRYTTYYGSVHRVNLYLGTADAFYIAPQFRWDHYPELQLNTQTIGAYVLQNTVYGGLFFQYNFPNEAPPPENSINAVLPPGRSRVKVLILNAGVDLRSLLERGRPRKTRSRGIDLGISYDINLGGINTTDTRGVLELSLRFNLTPRKRGGCDFTLGKFEVYDGNCPVRF